MSRFRSSAALEGHLLFPAEAAHIFDAVRCHKNHSLPIKETRNKLLNFPPQKLVHAAPEEFRELDEPRGLREAFPAFPFRDGGAFYAKRINIT